MENSEEASNLVTVHVQRMYHDRISVSVSNSCLVEDLRDAIRLQTEVPAINQRLIFRGRVLKTGDRLTDYGIGNGHVIHLVERPEGTTMSDWTEPNSTNTTTSSSATTTTTSSSSANSGAPRAGLGANVLFHAMQIDGNDNPAQIAQNITRSLMGALGQHFTHVAAATGGANNITPNPTNNNGSLPPEMPNVGRNNVFSNISDFFSGLAEGTTDVRNFPPQPRPQSSSQSQRPSTFDGEGDGRNVRPRFDANSPSSNADNEGRAQQNLDIDVLSFMRFLDEELYRITTLSNDCPIFPTTINHRIPSTAMPSSQALASLLEGYERALLMMAQGCQQLREALQSSSPTAVWPNLVNLNGLVGDMRSPLQFLHQIFTKCRARADGTIDVPPTIEVASTLANRMSRSIATNEDNMGNSNGSPVLSNVTVEMNFETINVEPPE